MVSARRARIVRKLAKPRNIVYTLQMPPIPLPRTAEQITFNSPYDNPAPGPYDNAFRQRWDG